MKWNTSASGLC